jgi:hypothetical protein
MGWTIEVQFLVGAVVGLFFFTTTCRLALGPTQPSIQWVPVAFTLGVKWLGYEADPSPPSSAKVKMGGAIPPLPNTSSWLSAHLSKIYLHGMKLG